MSSAAATFDRGAELPTDRRSFRGLPLAPAEGWLTVGSLVLLVLSLAWSIDEPGWIRGQGQQTDFLAPIGLAGLAFGFIGAKVGWGRWTTHLVGAALAGLILSLIAGDQVLGGTTSWLDPSAMTTRVDAAAASVVEAWADIAVRGRPFTNQFAHYVIVLGAIVWAAGQFAAYATFGHRRSLDAVIVIGLVLLTNMLLTSRDQLQLLILASIGGLSLLARSHAFDEQATWIRRRIGDPAAVTSLYLRGGSAFIALAIVGSLTLTATASSAPLQGLWADLPQRLIDLSSWLQKILPLGGASRPAGIVGFGPTAAITGAWTSDRGVAFTVDLPPDEARALYWRVATYGDFELTGWTWGETGASDVIAGGRALVNSADDAADLPARRKVEIDVELDGYRGRLVVSPQTVESVSLPTRVQLSGAGQFFVALELRDAAPGYHVTALVPVIGDEGGGLTENRLRVAGTDYPSSIRTRYLAVPPGAMGDSAIALLEEAQRLTPADNPYDLAKTLRTLLRDSGRFTYDTNVQDQPCGDLSTVECFARFRRGYCQYYASTMAILLREAGIPTRLAQGFLPGERDAAGHEIVLNSNAHAWVEVYFPGSGWVDFDPTGGNVARDVPLPSGSIIPVTPRPSFGLVTDRPGFSEDAEPSRDPTGGGTTNRPSGPGPFIALGVLLAISVGALALAAWRRGPRTPMEPDVAWRGVLRLARRFGFGPRPAQTVFEFAGALGDEVPQVKPELQTVARAKVEVAYGRRVLPEDRLRSIGDASRRLRYGLLRLVFRRRPGRRKGPRAL